MAGITLAIVQSPLFKYRMNLFGILEQVCEQQHVAADALHWSNEERLQA